MKELITDLYHSNRCPLGEGIDNALLYINKLIPLEFLKFKSGEEFGNWTVPDEWIVRDAWVKANGETLIDYQKHPLSLVVGSIPFQGTIPAEEFKAHLHYAESPTNAYLYENRYYDNVWGFTLPKDDIYAYTISEDGVAMEKADKLDAKEYEVFIDTERKPGVMQVGVHTIKGKTDKEILLFANLDGPYQANSNLSGVAVLINLVKDIKPGQYDHTIKLVFGPHVIGSVAYAHTQDLSNVDFMIAVNGVGKLHEQGFLLQHALNKEARINYVARLALSGLGIGFRQGPFRGRVGSEEYIFNDPKIGIPGILLTQRDYTEAGTSADTPDIIEEDTLELTKKALVKIIDYYEKDFIPTRNFKGPLQRSKYGFQTTGELFNLSWDYLIYAMGERYLSQLCCDFGLNFEHTIERLDILRGAGKVSGGTPSRKRTLKKTPRKKHNGLSGKTNVPVES